MRLVCQSLRHTYIDWLCDWADRQRLEPLRCLGVVSLWADELLESAFE